ncbi:MAG: oxygen-dependent coproporphyrinogen oxidase [Cytophagales bacterium]|nr:oxygen-dependent coproporphyrinogen oxidase [Cytophagales bacterium]
MEITKDQIGAYFKCLQDGICEAISIADGKGTFDEDVWHHHSGGGGRTRIIQNGNIIEKGGVNFSAVWGPTPDIITDGINGSKSTFYATGVSIVMHPYNPMVPIIHMNVRYFEMSTGTYWFGGGIDLTPHYVDEHDAKYFHTSLKRVCDAHAPHYYLEYKNNADNYFFIPHRGETRGIGGIFFDKLTENNKVVKSQIFEFVKSVGEIFAPIYTHFMQKNHTLIYNELHKRWQLIRRGRYAEFNLVYDKGTKFGLETSGRTESILMSLPPEASWIYNHTPEAGSAEQKTLSLLRKGISWI